SVIAQKTSYQGSWHKRWMQMKSRRPQNNLSVIPSTKEKDLCACRTWLGQFSRFHYLVFSRAPNRVRLQTPVPLHSYSKSRMENTESTGRQEPRPVPLPSS